MNHILFIFKSSNHLIMKKFTNRKFRLAIVAVSLLTLLSRPQTPQPIPTQGRQLHLTYPLNDIEAYVSLNDPDTYAQCFSRTGNVWPTHRVTGGAYCENLTPFKDPWTVAI